MKKLLTFFILICTSQVFSAELKLEKEEFLRKVSKDLITFDREPVIPTKLLSMKIPELGGQTGLQFILGQYKKKYPVTFKEEFFYAAVVRTRNYHYQISYDWIEGNCYYSFKSKAFEDRMMKIRKKFEKSGDKDLSAEEKAILKGDKEVSRNDFFLDKIELSYCEKVYKTKIKKYKPKRETPTGKKYNQKGK